MSAPAAEREIAKIKAGLAASTSAREKARRAKDVDAMSIAIADLMRWRCKAGLLLLAGAATHETFEISTTTAEHWAGLAQLDDQGVVAKIRGSVSRSVAAMRLTNTGTSSPSIRMCVSPWFRDVDGCLTRTVTAIDEPTVAATQP